MSQFSATRDFGIRRPTIPSLAAAQAEFNHWLQENTFERLHDSRGLLWTVNTQLLQGPQPHAQKGPLYRLRLIMVCRFSADKLVEAGILDEELDSRLLGLIGRAEEIVLTLNLGSWEERSLQGIIQKLREQMESVKAKWPSIDFSKEQKRCIGRWVEKSLAFGTRV